MEACEMPSAFWTKPSRLVEIRVRHEDLETLIGTVPEELVRSLVDAILNQDAPSSIDDCRTSY